jgi:hypothetical protein
MKMAKRRTHSEIIRVLADRYELSIKAVEDICMSQFRCAATVMSGEPGRSIIFPSIGKIYVPEKRLHKLKKDAEGETADTGK